MTSISEYIREIRESLLHHGPQLTDQVLTERSGYHYGLAYLLFEKTDEYAYEKIEEPAEELESKLLRNAIVRSSLPKYEIIGDGIALFRPTFSPKRMAFKSVPFAYERLLRPELLERIEFIGTRGMEMRKGDKGLNRSEIPEEVVARMIDYPIDVRMDFNRLANELGRVLWEKVNEKGEVEFIDRERNQFSKEEFEEMDESAKVKYINALFSKGFVQSEGLNHVEHIGVKWSGYAISQIETNMRHILGRLLEKLEAHEKDFVRQKDIKEGEPEPVSSISIIDNEVFQFKKDMEKWFDTFLAFYDSCLENKVVITPEGLQNVIKMFYNIQNVVATIEAYAEGIEEEYLFDLPEHEFIHRILFVHRRVLTYRPDQIGEDVEDAVERIAD